MGRTTIFVLAAAVGANPFGFQSPSFETLSPKEVVQEYWGMAMRGELLTTEGWNRACGYFTKPTPAPTDKVIAIVSNYYGVNYSSVETASATVDMEFADLGQIDSTLHYSPPAPTRAYKTSLRYRLVLVPRRMVWYGPDGKTILREEEIPESKVWQIEGSPGRPWTTVNTAIRYVLEMRDITTNPLIRKNADLTLAKLKKLH
jgi:hypothetical protein